MYTACYACVLCVRVYFVEWGALKPCVFSGEALISRWHCPRRSLCAVDTWLGASNLSQRPSRPAFFESSKAMSIVPEAIVAGSLIAPPSTTHGDSIVDDLIIDGSLNDPP